VVPLENLEKINDFLYYYIFDVGNPIMKIDPPLQK